MTTYQLWWWLLTKLHSWQDLAVGALALGGGFLAYLATMRQARLVAEQNIQLAQQSERLEQRARRDLAREVLKAARLFDGVLGRLEDDVEKLDKLLLQQKTPPPHIPRMFPEYRKRLNKPTLSVVWNHLSLFDPDTISTYLRLDADIEEFESCEIIGVDWFLQRLGVLAAVVPSLRSLIGSQAQSALRTIEATQEPQLSAGPGRQRS